MVQVPIGLEVPLRYLRPNMDNLFRTMWMDRTSAYFCDSSEARFSKAPETFLAHKADFS